MPQLTSAAAWVTAAASSWNELLMVLFFLFMQASLSAQVSWNLMLHLLGAACAVGSSGFTLSTLARTAQAALAGASGRPFLRQDPLQSSPAARPHQLKYFYFTPLQSFPGPRLVAHCVCLGGGWSLREESCALKNPGCHWGCRGAPAWAACP